MNLCLAVILSAFISTSFAQTPPEDMEESTSETTVTTKEVKPAPKPKMMKKTKTVKSVKTIQVMPITSCETADGKKLNDGDAGYKDCMNQVKTKKY